ncbi:HtaA domain-containing protein [Streptomyces sp. RKAG337]|uniref:HtaA domain-containing protein n=1 Tax=Streptomyces sp. RKAG337 TaxID=2893404 RepID=UPI002033646A|nr:HtaA domain-containing protein [Streptomyces sp. RKAG337]MCM2428767.1 HtaA domain-containing protein [Streptomyces sp. RKAG337]
MTVHPRPRSRRPLAFAIAAATAVGATALSLPALAADNGTSGAPGAPKIVLDGGTLDWGVKESFRNYVTGMAAGTIETAGGATKNADGTFRFGGAKGSYDTATHAVSVGFDGSVRFTSKLHGFDIELADLKIDTVGTTGTLTADVTSAGATADDVKFASLDLSAVRPGGGADGSMSFAGIPAALTADGSKAFNGMYKAGDKLDAASLTVKPQATPPTTPTTPPTTTPTKPPVTPPVTTPATPGATPTDAADPVQHVVDGNLDWGVKASFRSYVTSPVAAGKIETADGATASADAYRFPKGSGTYTADTKALNAGFAGSVRFLGHKENGAYSLDLKFSDVKVAVKGATGTLTADVSSKDRETGKVSQYNDLTVATLSAVAPKADGKVVTVSAAKAALTADGAKAFGGFYQAGAALDPVTVAVSLDKDASLPGTGTTGGTGGTGGTVNVGDTTGGTTGGSTTGGTTAGTTGGTLAATGAGAPSAALLGAAGLLVVVGAGATAVVARRRTS